MKENQKNILYFTRTMKLGGTEKVILQLCEIMKSEADKIIVCSCGGVNVEKLNKMGIKHYHIPDIEKKDIKTILTTLKIVSKIIKVENINIVHTHHRMAAFYTRILAFVKKFIFINTSHNTFYDKKILTRFAYKRANLIAVGNKVKENLCGFYGLSNKQVTVIYNAIKPFDGKKEMIKIITEYRDKGYFLVGNIGRLSEQKGMEYYIKAVSYVLRKYNKVQFFIVGDGEDSDKLKKLVLDMKLEKNIIFLGYRSDIQNVMSQFDLIVLSSLWEGFPLTPIEAFSVGKTIIATSVDGTIEIIDDKENGFLVNPKDSNSIAKKIIEIINDKDMKKALEKMAKKKYDDEFCYEKLVEKYTRYYEMLF